MIGDTLSFLITQFVLRDWVQRRFGRQLLSVEKGLDAERSYYPLGMRLLSVLPFFLVNLTMGMTRMPLRIFATVSFIWPAPSVALYVDVGTRLRRKIPGRATPRLPPDRRRRRHSKPFRCRPATHSRINREQKPRA